MLLAFFDCKGSVQLNFVPCGQITTDLYKKVLMCLNYEQCCTWMLHIHHPHPSYCPDLAQKDFFLFLKLKSTLEGCHFKTIEEIHENAIKEMYAILGSVFQEAFSQMKNNSEWSITSIRITSTFLFWNVNWVIKFQVIV